ncbi:unnamed protein product, partial [Prorocentrum cordatum]
MAEGKEQRLQKTETLYLRTMAARKSIHDSYLEQEGEIRAAERRIQEHEADRQELLQVLEGRDSEIVQLTEDLRRSRQRMGELQSQGKAARGVLGVHRQVWRGCARRLPQPVAAACGSPRRG